MGMAAAGSGRHCVATTPPSCPTKNSQASNGVAPHARHPPALLPPCGRCGACRGWLPDPRCAGRTCRLARWRWRWLARGRWLEWRWLAWRWLEWRRLARRGRLGLARRRLGLARRRMGLLLARRRIYRIGATRLLPAPRLLRAAARLLSAGAILRALRIRVSRILSDGRRRPVAFLAIAEWRRLRPNSNCPAVPRSAGQCRESATCPRHATLRDLGAQGSVGKAP